MSYKTWFEEHAKKHERIVSDLIRQGLSPQEIIEYFTFDNMCQKEPSFCMLYESKTPCHTMDNLNCYLCACPHFRFHDKGLHVNEKQETIKSLCSIESKKAAWFTHEGITHLDCSACIIPHSTRFITKVFDTDWKQIMHACEATHTP